MKFANLLLAVSVMQTTNAVTIQNANEFGMKVGPNGIEAPDVPDFDALLDPFQKKFDDVLEHDYTQCLIKTWGDIVTCKPLKPEKKLPVDENGEPIIPLTREEKKALRRQAREAKLELRRQAKE